MQPDRQDPSPEIEYPILIESPDYLARLMVNGWIVDGRGGGLVRGRRHSDGHIIMIQPTNVLGRYECVGYMEGGEYILSSDATAVHFSRLEEINADKGEPDPILPEELPGRVIDTHAEPHDKLLLIHKQFIINRSSTAKHLRELVEINAPHPYYSGRFFTDEELDVIRSLP